LRFPPAGPASLSKFFADMLDKLANPSHTKGIQPPPSSRPHRLHLLLPAPHRSPFSLPPPPCPPLLTQAPNPFPPHSNSIPSPPAYSLPILHLTTTPYPSPSLTFPTLLTFPSRPSARHAFSPPNSTPSYYRLPPQACVPPPLLTPGPPLSVLSPPLPPVPPFLLSSLPIVPPPPPPLLPPSHLFIEGWDLNFSVNVF